MKALKDRAFLEELKENSCTAISKHFGVQLPKKLRVEVIEEEKNTHYVVVPQSAEKVFHRKFNTLMLAAIASGTNSLYKHPKEKFLAEVTPPSFLDIQEIRASISRRASEESGLELEIGEEIAIETGWGTESAVPEGHAGGHGTPQARGFGL
jgi:hypothetical protein